MTRLPRFAFAIALALGAASPAFAQSFTLDQAIEHALASNKDLIAAREQPVAAHEAVTQARASVLPHVTLGAGYTRLSEVPVIESKKPNIEMPTTPLSLPTVTFEKVETKMGDEDNYQAQAKATQVLFTSGGALAGIRAAKAGERAAVEAVRAREEDIARQVAEAFWAVIFAQDVLAAQRESLRVAEAHLADVQTRATHGAASRFEVLRSEVEVANLRPEVKKSENQVLIAKTGLKSLIGLDLDAPIDAVGTLTPDVPTLGYVEARDEAMRERHELAALAAGVEANERKAWASTAIALPKVFATGSYTYQKPWYFENDWKDWWSLGVGVEIPVFDGLQALGARRQALSDARRMDLEANAAREKIDLAIRKSMLDLTETGPRVAETAENVRRAEETYAMAENAYRQGAMTNLEVLDAQLALTGARTRHIQALYDHQIAKTRLLAAAGRLVP